VEEVEESGPLEIIGDISTTSFFTGLSASQAVYSLGDAMVKAGLTMSFTEAPSSDEQESTSDASSVEADNTVAKEKPKKVEKKKKKKPFFFDPPQSRFEWRRHPIPARFLGAKDHAMVRDITEHKIFLNMSITEVLCTTTAEALAMGKFVIIPKHRKYSSRRRSSEMRCDTVFSHLYRSFAYSIKHVLLAIPKLSGVRDGQGMRGEIEVGIGKRSDTIDRRVFPPVHMGRRERTAF
jgi:hypothetical protein